jgi:competence protein ComEC
VATAAHLVTAPVIAALSGKVSMVAVVANMLAEPAVIPATVLGVVAAALAPFHQGAAELVARLAGPAVSWLIAVARHAAALPSAEVGWPGGVGGGLLLAVVTVTVLVLLRLRRLRVLVASALVGAVLVLLPVRVIAPPWPVTGWVAVACDVGQGDALVLATSEPGRVVLVDTGPEPALISACLLRLGVRQVPLVVLTHLHADHIGGLAAVLADRAVGAVATGPLRQPDWAMDQVRRQTDAAHVPLVDLGSGQRLEWPGLALDVLGPLRTRQASGRVAPSGTFVNDASLVLRASTAAGRMLLAGDVELAGQADLLASGADLRADVLKVPHHGSRYSLPQFLATVRPRIGVISVGAGNSYGHPSPLLLDTLVHQGTLVVRTDQAGDVAVTPAAGGPAVVRRGDPRAPPHHR